MSRKPKVKAKRLNESSPLKHHDLEAETWSVHTQGAIVPLNACTQGNDDYQRIGRKIVTRSIFIRGKLELYYLAQPALPGGGDVFFPSTLNRIMIVVDWQTNGQTPAIEDILEEPYPEAQLNMTNRKRFSVIRDECIVLDAVWITRVGNKMGQWGKTMIPIKFYDKVHIETQFNNLNNGSISSIVNGAIYMVLIGNAQYQIANNYNQLVVSTRIRFYDENAGTE